MIKLKENRDNSSAQVTESLDYGDVLHITYDNLVSYIDTEFHKKVLLGLPLARMSYTKTWGSSTYGSYNYSFDGDIFATGAENRTGYLPGLETGWDRAREEFYSQARRESTFNLGIALAESRETIGLIAYTATRIASSFKALRKGRIHDAFSALGISDNKRLPYKVRGFESSNITTRQFKRALTRRSLKAKNRLKFASNAWLEMRYGWTPLIYDVYGGAESIAKLLHDNREDVTLSAFYKISEQLVPSSSNFVGSGFGTHIFRYDCAFQISNPKLRNTSSLGLTNPALIAWELVPFSFVFDWFLPVGNWLENLKALEGLSFQSGTKTEFYNYFYSYGTKSYGYPYEISNRTNSLGSYGGITREGISSPPTVPTPRFSLFERMNGFRITDAFALLSKAIT